MFVTFNFLRQFSPFILFKKLRYEKIKCILKLLYVINHIMSIFYNFNFLNKIDDKSGRKKSNVTNIWKWWEYTIVCQNIPVWHI
jgi:hypothetical protein